MASLTIASKANQATTLPALLIAENAKNSDPNAKIDINFQDVETLQNAEKSGLGLEISENSSMYSPRQVIRELLRLFAFWQGKNEDLILEWIDRVGGFAPTDFKSVESPLLELDSHLMLRSYVVGYTVTPADFAVWGAIRGNKVAYAAVKKGAMLNVTRWFKFVEETSPWLALAVQSLNAHAQERKAAKSKEGASYDIALPDTEKGVVTRFPPEPSWVARSLSKDRRIRTNANTGAICTLATPKRHV
ncbi:MAG: hypothetical protein Q9208_001240 [Pyrenodesmia sp. 3 TL-2023]